MKKFNILILLAAIAFFLPSCNENENIVNWGNTKFYSDSFLKKYQPTIMTRTFEFSLDEDAQDLAGTEFEFVVFETTPEGKMVEAEGIIVYKNNEQCPGNVLKVTPNEGQVEIGIEFTAEAREGNHTYYLKPKSLNGLDEIDYMELANGFMSRKQNVMNPANELVMWILIVLASAYAAWVILLRPIFCPHVKFSKVDIYYPGTAGEVTVRTNGYCSLILSNKPIKQSWLKKLFFVQDQVEVNEVWSSQVRIESGKGRNVKVYTVLDVDSSPLDMPERRERFHVINEENQRIGVETW